MKPKLETYEIFSNLFVFENDMRYDDSFLRFQTLWLKLKISFYDSAISWNS